MIKIEINYYFIFYLAASTFTLNLNAVNNILK